MAQGTRGAGVAAAAGSTWVVPGEMTARVDRLPMSLMTWEICLIVQLGWSTSAATNGIARTLYAIGVTSRRVAPSFTVCISSSTFPSSCYAACPAGGSQTVPRPIA